MSSYGRFQVLIFFFQVRDHPLQILNPRPQQIEPPSKNKNPRFQMFRITIWNKLKTWSFLCTIYCNIYSQIEHLSYFWEEKNLVIWDWTIFETRFLVFKDFFISDLTKKASKLVWRISLPYKYRNSFGGHTKRRGRNFNLGLPKTNKYAKVKQYSNIFITIYISSPTHPITSQFV